jgi:hypothetical protein
MYPAPIRRDLPAEPDAVHWLSTHDPEPEQLFCLMCGCELPCTSCPSTLGSKGADTSCPA